MNVLSLFDGISCGQLALKRAGIPVDNYYASEIEKHSIQITQRHWPNTIQVGDVTKVYSEDLPGIDLLIGGSPCQGFSLCGQQKAFEDPRSKLFFEYVRLLYELKPRFFLLENVRMKKEFRDEISYWMDCDPIEINSADFSAQNRKRLYWTNIPIANWQKKNLVYRDIMDHNQDPLSDITDRCYRKTEGTLAYKNTWSHMIRPDQKIRCLTAAGQGITNAGATNIFFGTDLLYSPSPEECERAQTMPTGYTAGIPRGHRYRALGNGWTVDVIAHIFRGMWRFLFDTGEKPD